LRISDCGLRIAEFRNSGRLHPVGNRLTVQTAVKCYDARRMKTLMRCLVLSVTLCGPRLGASQSAQGYLIPPSIPRTSEEVALVRQDAERGDPKAELTLGFLFATGLSGVTRDPAAALTWYRKASQHGSADATMFIAVFYDAGQGGQQDHAEALKWFREAAMQGNVIAQVRMGREYEAVKDFAQALDWYRKAAALGNEVAENMLGDMFAAGRGVDRDYREAAVWYRMSADQGNGYGAIRLAEQYDKGLGVPQDAAQAVKLYLLEAEKGGPPAQFYVGTSFREGRGGLARDPIEAHKWFNLAAAFAGENKVFADARDDVERTMTASDVLEARRRAKAWMDAFWSKVTSTPDSERTKQALLEKLDAKPK
jgi:uncharacterized protein